MSELRVCVRRKQFHSPPTLAIEGMDFVVEDGEFVALVGPSGAGKSTLLGIIAGLDSDYDGSIVGADADSGLGYVFQSPRLMPWLSVRDNLRLVLDDARDDDARLDALLAEVGLEGFETAWPGQLSGGMQRRVALARAFAVQPRLLLMDEPFVSLDEPLAWRLRGMLSDYWERHRPTVVYVTHDLREALALADRVLFLSARPASVMLDHRVALPRPRPRVPHDRALDEYLRDLMTTHPDLLAGELATAAGGESGGDDERSSAA